MKSDSSLNALLIGGSPSDAEIISVALRFFPLSRLKVENSLQADLTELKSDQWDIIFLDLSQPNSAGVVNIEKVRRGSPQSAIIVLSDCEDVEVAVGSLKSGADDFLSKTRINEEKMQESIRYVVEKQRVVADQNRNENEFRTLFDILPAMIWIKDTENKILRINEQAAKAVGLTVKDIEGKHSAEVYPKDAEKFYQDDLGVIRSGKSRLGIIESVADDSGNSIWVRTDKIPRFNAKGEVSGIMVLAQDITQIQRMEEEYEQFFKLSQDMFCIAGIDGFFKHLNPAFETTLGFSLEELKAKKFLDFVHPEDRASTLDAVQQLSQGLKVTNFENRYVCKDGTYRVLSWRAAPFGSRMFSNARDVTELKIIMETLRSNKDTIAAQAALLDETREAIVWVEGTGSVLIWNRGAEEIYGYDSATAVGKNIVALGLVSDEKFGQIQECLNKDRFWSGELPFQKDKKTNLIVEGNWRLTSQKHEGRETILFVGSDITEKKMVVAQAHRTQRIESIGTLAGGIAHDLNNVLAPIMLSIEILKIGEENSYRLSALDMIDLCSQRAAAMVAQVLTFARGVEGDRHEVKTKSLLREIQKIVNDTFLKNIQIRTSVAPDTKNVLGDITQLYQVLLNLCVNARDAMPSGGTISISAKNVILEEKDARMSDGNRAGEYVQITIEDNGTGIPPEILDRIFEPFFTTKEIGKGTGLGLSTSLAIIKSHDGFIRVQSEMGHGTLFNIFLPVLEALLQPTEQDSSHNLPRGNGERILVVDDEEGIREITQRALEAFGYRVIVASSGAEAIGIYQAQKDDIAMVLTDMMMPLMNGSTLILELRKIKQNVVILAASGLASEAEEISKENILAKPFTTDMLLRAIRASLGADSR